MINGVATTYAYDGNGMRVSKTTGGITTTYVYDAFGNLAAEYGGSGTSPCGTATCYVTWDHLGSTRMLTDSTRANNTNLRRYDYLPFGQEIPSGVDGRATGMGYTSTPDVTNPKFAGEYRDPGTSLDWLAVRAMSGARGRFQSVDPDSAGAAAGDPLGEPAGSFYGALKFNQGLKYAATTASKTFGTTHLVYPYKSSVFRSLMKESQKAGKVSMMSSVVLAEGEAFWDEMQRMRAGRAPMREL